MSAVLKPAAELTPGEYRGVPMHVYLAMPAVSASIIKKLVEACPRAAWFESWLNPKKAALGADATPASDGGTIAHSILLEGKRDCIAVINPNEYPSKTTGEIPKGWTNGSIRAARDAAIAAGKVPVFPEKANVIEAMVAAAREFIESLRESEPAIWAVFQPSGGESELTLVWDDNGTLCRARPDRISTDRCVIVDYKTGGTTAEPDTWGRTQMVRMGYYTSAAFYRRGVEKLFGKRPDYVFLVQEQEAPYLCSLVGIDPAGYELGARKVARGLVQWKGCAAANRWPGYPNRVAYAEIPAWEWSRFESQPGPGEGGGIPFDPSRVYPSRDELARAYDNLPE